MRTVLLPRAEVHVRDHPIPGSDQVISLTLTGGAVISVASSLVAGRGDVSLRLPGHDETALTVGLDDVEARTLAALLSAVRLVAEAPLDRSPVGGASRRTSTIGAGSPAVDVKIAETGVPSPDDARVLAVIRDDTPERVVEDADPACQPGDRLVVVGRSSAARAGAVLGRMST